MTSVDENFLAQFHNRGTGFIVDYTAKLICARVNPLLQPLFLDPRQSAIPADRSSCRRVTRKYLAVQILLSARGKEQGENLTDSTR
jgi:hypothetical protein